LNLSEGKRNGERQIADSKRNKATENRLERGHQTCSELLLAKQTTILQVKIS
jgi:hypothetical protein